MSKYTIVVWVIMVMVIFSCIFTIGIKFKQEYPYVKYKKDLEQKTKLYISEKSIMQPTKDINVVVTTDELLKTKLIKTTKVKNKNCSGKIIVSKNKTNYKYDVKVKCK